MKYLTGNQTRQMFLDYFKSKGHMIEPGASLIPYNDPTLLWINAGVAALKKYFDGTEKPASNRIANAQKSIRTNDIENVGKTARHHTFFEMLGNFSIGDYFKREAIHFAWEFLTSEEWIGFDKDRLYITVYTDDNDAYDIWTKECGVAEDHIWRTDDNFWEIGEGPGGPDSEIFYDRGEEYDPDHIGIKLFHDDMENDRYVEVWNVVFSQYDCNPSIDRKDYKELPHKNIDTGMGLERLVSIIQGGETNFDTDLFLPIIEATERLSNIAYKDKPMAYRVIADHIRTVTFALSDGAMFDKAGRGYVLRRILRRAVRYGKKLGIDHAFLYQLVDIVAENMKEFYDYLPAKKDLVKAAVKKEEEAFQKTLNQGEKRIQNFMNNTSDKIIDGKTAFMLYDTYGFPLELTIEIADEKGFTVDKGGFDQEMKAQQTRARNARGEQESFASQKADLMDFTLESSFDYNPAPIKAKIIGLFENGVKTDKLIHTGEVILDHTVFYAEMGGQCGDTGYLENGEARLKVTNTTAAPNGQHLHFVEIEKGVLHLGDEVMVLVDLKRRILIENNHTATHLLDAALKKVLGEHVAQAGSYIDDKRLRFDFTHPSKLTDEQIQEVEELVNQQIFAGTHLTVEYKDKEEAVKDGATALFDEKYGDVVRVVSIGDFSSELCGGCHVNNTSQIGLFKIDVETSVGSGIRRIEAVTNQVAYRSLKHEEQVLLKAGQMLKIKNKNDLLEKLELLLNDLNDSHKKANQLSAKLNALEAKEKVDEIEEINGRQFLYVHVTKDVKAAKALVVDYRDSLKNGVVVVSSSFEGKNSYFIGCTKGFELKAGDLIKEMNEILDGRGGGKPDMAQGGCQSLDKIDEAVRKIKSKM